MEAAIAHNERLSHGLVAIFMLFLFIEGKSAIAHNERLSHGLVAIFMLFLFIEGKS